MEVRSEHGITITARHSAGIFWGVQTLRQLIPVATYKTGAAAEIQEVTVIDAPRFDYRGLMIDVCRNFQTKESILKVLDAMTFYKINKFHFHLSDDEGWRLAIDGLDELTAYGANRGYSANESEMLIPSYGSGPDPSEGNGSGFYSREDFIEILKYANERHIEVIPEFDFPGHARAAIKSMDYRYRKLVDEDKEAAEQYLLRDLNDASEYASVQIYDDNVVCPCKEATYSFLDKVVAEVVAMYGEAGAPLTTIHTGGDEVPVGVWTKSPICDDFYANNDSINDAEDLKSYFLARLVGIMEKHDLATAAFEDATLTEVEKDGEITKDIRYQFSSTVRPYIWNSVWGWGHEDLGYRLANAGFKTVLGNVTNFYYDLAYDNHPLEPGFYWGGFNNVRKGFEFMPHNMYKSAFKDLNGSPLDPSMMESWTALEKKENILGVQGLLWSETVKGNEMMEYYLFPKLIGMAHRGWASKTKWDTIAAMEDRKAAIDADWNVFANSLGTYQLPHLSYIHPDGLNYRVPVPGAKKSGDDLLVNVAYPGLVVRYTTNGDEPTKDSPVAEGGTIAAGGKLVKLRCFDAADKGSRTVEVK